MFKDEAQLMEFICEGEEATVELVVTEALKDAFLYEDENFVKAMDKYVGMLETEEIDEKLEEHLSTIIAGYVNENSAIFENLIFEDEVIEEKMGNPVKAVKAKIDAYKNSPERIRKQAAKAVQKRVKKAQRAKKWEARKEKFASSKAGKLLSAIRGRLSPSALKDMATGAYKSASGQIKKLGSAVSAGVGKVAKRLTKRGRLEAEAEKRGKANEKLQAKLTAATT